MSATKDPSQKPTFIFSNLHPLFKKQESELPQGEVLKTATKTAAPAPAATLAAPVAKAPVIAPYDPIAFLSKRVEAKKVVPAPAVVRRTPPNAAVEDLKANLNRLQDLQGRLRFMLQELEDLVGESK